MFIGRYYHNLETNGRVAIPKPFRDKSQKWIVTRGLDGGIFLLPPENFDQHVQELSERTFTKKMNRDFIRLMVNSAQEIKTDSLGRVVLPTYLTELAGLHKKIVVVGSYSYVEIWDQKKYHQYLDNLSETAEVIAEKLTERI